MKLVALLATILILLFGLAWATITFGPPAVFAAFFLLGCVVPS